jgi:hypothetical protein
MEEVLKKVELEDINASDNRKKETKRLIANLKNITSEMKDIAEGQDKISNDSLFKLLGDVKDLKGMTSQMDEDQIEKLKNFSPELGDLLKFKDSLEGLSNLDEAMNVLSPSKSLRGEEDIEKSTESQSQADRANPTEEQD